MESSDDFTGQPDPSVVPEADRPSDKEHCRTKPFTKSFSECLENDPMCRYSLHFGHTRLCKHPRRCEFGVTMLDDDTTRIL
jgi:hypothetical protein